MAFDIVNGLIGLVVGLCAGLVTGYFFERRATTAAETENARLRDEISALRESVYTVGGHRHRRVQIDHEPHELAEQLGTWLHGRQDAEGRVLRSRAIAEFTMRGFSQKDLDEAFGLLCSTGRLRVESTWVRLL